jgi:hypothetical protein
MTIDLTWLCIPIGLIGFLGAVTVLMTLSVRSRLRYAKRIQAAQARGAFDDMNARKPQYLWLGVIALVGVLGVVVTIGMLILQLLHVVVLPVELIFIAFGIFGSMGAIAGTLMQREIERRL